jgi:hypothetical protein
MQDGGGDQGSMGSWVVQLCNLCARGYARFDDLVLLCSHITIDSNICYHLLWFGLAARAESGNGLMQRPFLLIESSKGSPMHVYCSEQLCHFATHLHTSKFGTHALYSSYASKLVFNSYHSLAIHLLCGLLHLN